MAMLSARFHDAAAARQVSNTFINDMGAAPDLVLVTTESPRPATYSAGAAAEHPKAVPNVEATRVAIHDTAIDASAARAVFEAAGAVDIRPIQ